MKQGAYRIVKWTDERGQNTVAGFVRGPRLMDSIGYGLVEVPAGADVFQPVGVGIPMEKVGTVR